MYIQTVHSCRHRLSTHMVQTKQQLQTRSIPVYTEHSYGKQLYTYIKQINKYYTAKDQVHQGLGTIQYKQNTATDKDQVHTQYIQTSRTQLQARTYTHMIQTYRTQLQTRTYTHMIQTCRTQLQTRTYTQMIQTCRTQLQTRTYTQMIQTRRTCLLYTSPSPRDINSSRMPSSA